MRAPRVAPQLRSLLSLAGELTTVAPLRRKGALDLPFEAAYNYKVHALPPGRVAAREQGAPDSWNPSLAEIESLPHVMDIQEESSCFLRVILAALGGLNLRALTLHCCSYGPPAARARRSPCTSC